MLWKSYSMVCDCLGIIGKLGLRTIITKKFEMVHWILSCTWYVYQITCTCKICIIKLPVHEISYLLNFYGGNYAISLLDCHVNIESYNCSKECASGCWGPGPVKCVQCKHLEYRGRCLSHCAAHTGSTLTVAGSEMVINPVPPVYPVSVSENSGPVQCARCHFECASGCSGPVCLNNCTCKIYVFM